MDFTNVKELMKRFVATGPAGNAISVSLNGKQVFEHYEGLADVEASRSIGPDTVYRLFSSSKEVTAAAALILYERGLYLLNDPVADYLPEFANVRVTPYENNGVMEKTRLAQNPLRVRDCFCMTTGRTYAGNLNYTQVKMGEVQGRMIMAGPHTLAELMKAYAEEVPLMFEPGTSWNYGMSIDLLGRLIEVWSGKSLGQFFQDEMFDPLGMKDTGFYFKGNMRERVATPYNRADGELVRFDNPLDFYYEEAFGCELGGQGLLTTLHDYTRFGQMLAMGGTLDGVRVLGPQTIDLMRRNHLTPPQMAAFTNTSFRWPQVVGYGYGLGMRTMVDPAAAGANSVHEFGWSGMAGTWGCYDPVEKLSVQYMHQCMPNDQNPDWCCHPRIRNAVYAALD